jgi:hypothetical protein
MTKLICPECRRENEGERIYCHDCGAKLDRSKVISTVKAADRREQERRRVHDMFDPHRAKTRLLFFRISKVILGSCAAALVVLMVLPPDVPPPKKEALSLSQIGLDLENAIGSHRAAPLQYTEDQVNEYLGQALKGKQKALNKPLLDFKRVFVGLGEGKCDLTVERSLFGWSLFTTDSVAVQLSDGKIQTSSKGGAIGRLPIYPQIMEYLEIAFADVWSALDRERKLVTKTSAIEFHDKAVEITIVPPQ